MKILQHCVLNTNTLKPIKQTDSFTVVRKFSCICPCTLQTYAFLVLSGRSVLSCWMYLLILCVCEWFLATKVLFTGLATCFDVFDLLALFNFECISCFLWATFLLFTSYQYPPAPFDLDTQKHPFLQKLTVESLTKAVCIDTQINNKLIKILVLGYKQGFR